jgi:hypothetical protein
VDHVLGPHYYLASLSPAPQNVPHFFLAFFFLSSFKLAFGLYFPTRLELGDSELATHQHTIHWMLGITRLWMNLN